MTTPGEMEEIDEEDRTTHLKLLGKFLLPKPTRKRVAWKGEKRVVFSSDMGGQERFWNLWIDDMVSRQVEAVVYVFDDRAVKGGDDALQQIAGFKYLVDAIVYKVFSSDMGRYRSLKVEAVVYVFDKGKRCITTDCWVPKLIMLVPKLTKRIGSLTRLPQCFGGKTE